MKADLSRERRRHVLQLLRRSGVLTDPTMDPGDHLVYTVGALICNDVGYLTQSDLAAALNDPSVVQAAQTLLRKAASHGA